MNQKSDLERQIAELQEAQSRAETLYQISRDLNAACDKDELLSILARPAQETGAVRVILLYIDLDEAGEPEWFEIAAYWK